MARKAATRKRSGPAGKRGASGSAAAPVKKAPQRARQGTLTAATGSPEPGITRSPFALRDADVERALRTGEQSGLLEDLFGSAGLEELRRLARDAEMSGVRGGDRVFILPGIMGSKLGYEGLLLFDDTIWVDPAAIVIGRLDELRLNGRPRKIQVLGVILLAYLALKLRLRARGHAAEFFPFDWRLTLSELGKRLAAEMARDRRRTHLVCHSMGGLVARGMLTKAIPDNLGRIITLGTPHNGSYSPVQAFRGMHSIVQKVATLDLRHDQADLAGIFGTFPGLLEMIPSPRHRPLDLFDLKSWPAQGPRPSERMLKAARTAQEGLAPLTSVAQQLGPGGLTGPRAVLIVGTGSETVVSARRETANGSDEFVYDLSDDGDGTVPLDLARVPGLPTYRTAAGHGRMPNDEDVARAVDNIIATGQTEILPLLPEDAAPQRATGLRRSVSDSELRAAGARSEAARGSLGRREQRELLVEVAAPPTSPPVTPPPVTMTSPLAFAPAGDATSEPAALSRGLVIGRRRQQRLEITLANGSITDADADAYVFGVFRGVAPAGVAAAVDTALAGRDGTGPLTELIARRMVSAGVGEITSLPVTRYRSVRTDSIMLVGLGNIGDYRDSVLEAVGESVMRAVLLSRLESFAVVPIGAGAGTPPSVVITRLVNGFIKTLRGLDGARLRGVTVCETDKDRYREILETFHQLFRTPLFDDIEVTLTEVELPPAMVRGAPQVAAPHGPDPVYLLVQQEMDGSGNANVAGSVLTAGGKGAIVKGVQRLDAKKVQTYLDKVKDGAGGMGDVARFGRELSRLVLHPDLLAVLARETSHPTGGGRSGDAAPLVVVHDAAMSRIPWEVLHLDSTVPPALAGGLSHRYNGGVLSAAKWVEERVQHAGLDILLVVDPTEDLAGARKEGDRILEIVRQKMPGARVRELRGPAARRRELLDCFASGAFDVVHYAGHAYFDAVNRSRSGILCHGQEVLSGADLVALSRLPSLVVFNACESARVRRVMSDDQNRVTQEKVDEPVRGTVGFAEAFLSGGIANYVGTYWPVGDDPAETFATTFYGALLLGRPIGEALLTARRSVAKLKSGAADWADYVFYGDPRFRLKTPAAGPGPTGR